MTPFESFNAAILTAEVPIYEGPTPKMLFVCGTPRSGTTILSQSLSYFGDVGFIDNLIAKFASNPILGVMLSRALDLPKEFTGFSDFGRTTRLSEPHEFGLGWENMLVPSGTVQPKYGEELEPESLQKLEQLSRSFGRAVVFKSFAYLWFLTEIANAFPEACFVHIRRDISETAESLEKLYRLRSEGGITPLWTSAVMQKTMIDGSGFKLPERCLMQITDIDIHIRGCLANLDSDRRLEIQLDDYRLSPDDTVSKILNYFKIPLDSASRKELQ